MNKLFKLLLLFLIPIGLSVLTVSCENYEDKLTGSNPSGSATDVSSRITGFSSDFAGAGTAFSVLGNNLGSVTMVNLGGLWIQDFSATDSEVSFTVPANATLGQQDLSLVFPGTDRATKKIEVVPVPAITYFTPKAAGAGMEVTITGNNLSFVTSVSISGVNATMTSQENTIITFTMPAGASTAPIVIANTSGSTTSSTGSIIACESDGGNLACLPLLNTNGSFEAGEVGDVAVVGAPGWNLLGGSGGHHTAEITNEEYYDGFQSAKITIGGTVGTSNWHIQPTSNVNLIPGDTYHMSVWVKGTGIQSADFAVDTNGTGTEGGSWYNYNDQNIAATTNQWVLVEFDFVVNSSFAGPDPTNSRFSISLGNILGNANGSFYLDDLRIVHID